MVAPIRITSPSSTAGSSASCWALLKRWISSRKNTVPMPFAFLRCRGALDHRRTSARPACTALASSKAAPVCGRGDPRERRLAAAGRPVEDHRVKRAALDRGAQRRLAAEQVLLAGELVERPRTHPRRERLALDDARRTGTGSLLAVE